MSTDEFRRIALSFRGSVEGSHQGHPDFRVHGAIFATLSYPDAGSGMVKLSREQQERFVLAHPDCFQPVKGAWGRRGATRISLFSATAALARKGLALAHHNVCAQHHRPPQDAPQERPAARASRKRAS